MDDIEVKLLDNEGKLINFWYPLGSKFDGGYFEALFRPPEFLERPRFIEVGIVEEPGQ